MKRNSCLAILAFLLILYLPACQEEQLPVPHFSAETTKEVVLGKWCISKIDYSFCRSGHCNNSSYQGAAQDYFEFRADSAFLYRKGATAQAEKFKVYYNMPGAFILNNKDWSGKYEVKECKQKKLILVNTFTGTDPYAAFTDTYFLFKH